EVGVVARRGTDAISLIVLKEVGRGLAHRFAGETHFLIGRAAEAILSAASLFSPAGLKLHTVSHLQRRKSITLKPFTITPFLIDHSAYDSYSVLVEAAGNRMRCPPVWCSCQNIDRIVTLLKACNQ